MARTTSVPMPIEHERDTMPWLNLIGGQVKAYASQRWDLFKRRRAEYDSKRHRRLENRPLEKRSLRPGTREPSVSD